MGLSTSDKGYPLPFDETCSSVFSPWKDAALRQRSNSLHMSREIYTYVQRVSFRSASTKLMYSLANTPLFDL